VVVNLLSADPLTLAYHELRSPLGLIATAARAAAEDPDPEQARHYCKVISRTADMVLRTTEQVLSLAEAARVAPGQLYRPHEVIADVVNTFTELGLALRLEIAPAARELVMDGVPNHLEALVQSLLGNAFDHGEPGEPVCVMVDSPGEELIVGVSNPIPQSCRHRGLGVGAYLSRRLAEQMGGVLRVGPEGSHYRALLCLPASVASGINT
jgi:signal transduction histidine kinase